MQNSDEIKLGKLLRLALSSEWDGEASAAIRRMRIILKDSGHSAAEVMVRVVSTMAPATMAPPPQPEVRPKTTRDLAMEVEAQHCKLPFGKFKGESFWDVWERNPHYFKAMHVKICAEPEPTWVPPADVWALMEYFLRRYPERVTSPLNRPGG